MLSVILPQSSLLYTIRSGMTNLPLASHMLLFEGLFVAFDKSKYPEFKKMLLVELFQYSEQRTYVNHSIPL